MATVLIVDDREVNRQLMTALLRHAGHRSLEASGVEKGLQLVRAEKPDLVICDIYMPGADGTEFVRRLHAEPALAATPVIFWSSTYLESEARSIARDCGVRWVLSKGGNVEEIRRKIEEALSTKVAPVPDEDLLLTDGRDWRESARRLRSLVEHLPAIIYQAAFEESHRMLYVSPQIETRLGYDRTRWLVPPGLWSQKVHPADRARVLEAVRKLGADGSQLTLHYRLIAEGGQEVWFRDDAIVIGRTAEGAPILQGVLVDITEQKVAEQALVQGSRVAALTADVSMALARSLDLPQMFRTCCQLILGHLEVELVRIWTVEPGAQNLELRSWAGLEPPADKREIKLPIGVCGAGIVAAERRPLLVEDATRDARFNSSDWALCGGLRAFAGQPLIVGGELVGVLSVHSSRPLGEPSVGGLAAIAEIVGLGLERARARAALERSESMLRQSQKMEAFGQLAGGVAHDFNNLLTIISGYTDFIMTGAPEGSPFHRDAEVIARTAEKARSLTQQLLAFSRKQVLQPRIFSPNNLVIETEKMLRRLIGEHIALRTDLAESVWMVRADPGQMDQVLLNLAVNARDAMPGGGSLTITTANVAVSASSRICVAPGEYVRLSVSDSGTGMDEATQARIFEPFFTTKPQGKGTGLGLATVHGIVQQSGGGISVSSRPGEGTRFDVYIPRSAAAEAAVAHRPAAERTARGQGTVLVVDDEEGVREMFRRTLAREGYQVLLAENGRSALELTKGHEGPIDLVITDVVMPEMGGAALATALQESRPLTRVLFVSGYTDDELGPQGGLDAGIHLMNKPVTPSELASRVRQLLEADISIPASAPTAP
ncbi:MAG: response regulator [Candidatus Wallbacteria bacterium]|nr:response regulator [Candidatus Wallbacteria bacterium]